MSGAAIFSVRSLLDHAGIDRGMTVLEIFPSRSGYVSFAAAERVGEAGLVYALDPRREVVSHLEGVRRMRGVPHLRVMRGNPEEIGGTGMTDGSVDRILVVNGLWLVEEVPTFIRELRRLLKRDGEILTADWHPGEKSPFAPPVDRRVSEEDACAAFHANACAACGRVELAPTHWGWRFVAG